MGRVSKRCGTGGGLEGGLVAGQSIRKTMIKRALSSSLLEVVVMTAMLRGEWACCCA